jgi:hypothetical protein
MRKFLEIVGLLVVLIIGFKLVFAVAIPLLGFALKAVLVVGAVYLGYRVFQSIGRGLKSGGGRKYLR